MKSNLIFGNKSILVDIDDTFAHLCIMVDENDNNQPHFNYNRWLSAYDHVCAKYIEIGKKIFTPEINDLEFVLYGNMVKTDVVDNVQFLIKTDERL